MRRQAVLLVCILGCASSSAHLNHIQFAAIDESGGRLHVRFRMSADMFMTNLELEIKAGRMPADSKNMPLDEIVARYFGPHLRLELAGSHPGEGEGIVRSTRFAVEERTGDWIADFFFDAPSGAFTIFCDAFMENNPRTQTLARISWRGHADVFHFRAGSERHLISALPVQESSVSRGDAREAFVSGLARGLRAYFLMAAGVLACLALRRHTLALAALFSSLIAAFLQGPVVERVGLAAGLFCVVATASFLAQSIAAGIKGPRYA